MVNAAIKSISRIFPSMLTHKSLHHPHYLHHICRGLSLLLFLSHIIKICLQILFNKLADSIDVSLPIHMAKQTQGDIDHFIQRARPTNRDLVRRDISQATQLSISSLLLKVAPYFYNDGTSKELLGLCGTVACQYQGNRYNIPIEIWLQQDHPHVAPLAYVKPTCDMYVSPKSQDVQPDGTIIIPYLKSWRHPTSDLSNLLKAMSESFTRSPPVYSAGNGNVQLSTPYPVHYSSMPTPMSMPTPIGQTFASGTGRPTFASVNQATSPYSYPYVNPTATGLIQPAAIPQDVYRDSLQSAVLDKIRDRLNEFTQIGKAQIDSLNKTESQLIEGEKRIETFIRNAQSQQNQAQIYLKLIERKLGEMCEATNQMSSSLRTNSIVEDALLISPPLYKQLVLFYGEEHAIQDLLFYLSDGLQRRSIGLDIYLKHVRELSRRQFLLRATMRKCRQISGLPVK